MVYLMDYYNKNVKKALTSLDVAAIVSELRREILGLYVSNVYQFKEVVLLKFHSSEKGTRRLLVIPGVSLHLTSFDFEKTGEVPGFCKLLRRYLRRKRLVDVKQLDFDRVVFLDFSSRDGERVTLVVELVREGNVILVDESSTIVAALRYQELRDRAIKRGLKYVPPPRWRKDLFEYRCADIEISEDLESLLRNFNISREFAREIEYRVKKFSETRGIPVAKALEGVIEEIRSAIKEGSLKPHIVFLNEQKVNVHPFFFLSEEGARRVEYHCFNEAVDQYFKDKLEGLLKIEGEEGKIARIKATVSDVKKRIEEFRSKADILESFAKSLSLNLDQLHLLLDETYKRIDSGDFDGAKRLLENFLARENVELKVEIDPGSKNVVLKVRGVEILLERGESAGKLVSKIFDAAKKYKQKANKALEVLQEKLERREERLERAPPKALLKVVKAKKWYEKFHWFISTEGVLVIGGRDATQNEILVKKYLDENEVFMHADIHGASVVIVKGLEFGERTLDEAAVFAAAYSNAWKLGFYSVDVFWVYGRQVSKKPPSGQYLRKGSFMIYGKRNYIRKVPVQLSLGMVSEEGSFSLLIAPPAVVKSKCRDYIVLSPGSVNKNDFVKTLAKFLSLLKTKGIRVEFDVNELLERLPRGGFRIVEKVGIFKEFRGGGV